MIYPEVILNMLISLAIYEVYREFNARRKSRRMAEKLIRNASFIGTEEQLREHVKRQEENAKDQAD